ncbi:hypothetical protein D0T84_01135 [Dysgonomonas sp. 521]|uniref:tyrosine-type recombinase/integrase n=1 Tax=Dysgonomonas sp. 521 TaxID=2302932 RepID=UPI0013D8A26E|nr:site-specific integrase [Dysgonomonas sp. 521]NDV93520.1 hypothetical protein [Dysgonomonas sp. 521]
MVGLSINFIFDVKGVSSLEKQGLLQIVIRQNKTSRRKYISTGIRLYKNQFSDKKGFTCINHENAKDVTSTAWEMYNKIEKFCLSDRCIKWEDIEKWDKDKNDLDSVIKFIESEMKLRNMEYNTLKAHVTLVNKLNDFKKIKIFSDLTYSNITEFDKYMRDKGIGNVSINKNHSLFNLYIKIAINKDLIEKNPYNKFTPPKGKNNDPVFLTQDEVENIKKISGLNDKLEKVKDLFIFQCYTGMAYIDMQGFSKNSIQVVDEQEVIRSSRTKTDESFILLFLPDAKKIAEKYNYNLPKISNQKYNDYLKLLIAHPNININKKVTSHTARHTFATYLLNKGIPIETVSKTLGHASIKQTQLYARLLGKKVIDDMKKLL